MVKTISQKPFFFSFSFFILLLNETFVSNPGENYFNGKCVRALNILKISHNSIWDGALCELEHIVCSKP